MCAKGLARVPYVGIVLDGGVVPNVGAMSNVGVLLDVGIVLDIGVVPQWHVCQPSLGMFVDPLCMIVDPP